MLDPRRSRLAPAALALALLAACSSNPVRRTGEVPRKLEPQEVPAAIEKAEAALAAGRPELALEWAFVASRVEGAPTEQRDRAAALMERAADERVAQLAAGDGDPEELAELIDVGLPRQVAVTAGIRAAQRMVAEGDYKRAFEVLKELDELYPRHPGRTVAGELLGEIGIELSHRKTGWWIFGRTRPTAYQALEYLVLNYPLADRCPDAYWRLGEMYEEDGKWETAIDRLQELVVYHGRSVYVPQALARIPHLRLASIESPEYDRKALVLARQELERWLQEYPGHELELEVRAELEDARRRLAQNDLVVARFYRTVGNEFGVRYHATRAAEEARLAGDAGREEEALAMISALGPEDGRRRTRLVGETPIPDVGLETQVRD